MSTRRRSRTGLLLLLLLMVSYSYFIYRGPMWNADSRMALVFAIVDRQSLSIDEYHEMTEDKSFANGHYYSDKAIGASVLAAPFYLLLRQGPLSTMPPEAYFLTRYLVTFFAVSIPSALLGVVFFSVLPAIGVAGVSRLLATIGLALGTIAFPLSTVLYGHQAAAFALFASFVLLWRCRRMTEARQVSRPYLVGAGFLAGCAVATEYPALIGVAFLTAYVMFFGHSKLRQCAGVPAPLSLLAMWFGGLAGPMALVLAYNTIAFGGPMSQGYAHLGGAPEFINGMSQGLLGLTFPSASALWGITFSQYRGLFFLSPFLLLAIPGWNHLRNSRFRLEAYLLAGIVAAFLLFNASYFQWDGGHSVGPRHLVPILPFLGLLAAVGIARAPGLAALLVATSVALTLLYTSTDAFPGPQHANPLLDVAIPGLLSGTINNNWGMLLGLSGVFSLLPLLIVQALALAVLYYKTRRVEAIDGDPDGDERYAISADETEYGGGRVRFAT